MTDRSGLSRYVQYHAEVLSYLARLTYGKLVDGMNTHLVKSNLITTAHTPQLADIGYLHDATYPSDIV